MGLVVSKVFDKDFVEDIVEMSDWLFVLVGGWHSETAVRRCSIILLFSKSEAAVRRCSIILLFSKILQIWYLKIPLSGSFSNKFAGLKRDAGTDLFLWVLGNSSEKIFRRTHLGDYTAGGSHLICFVRKGVLKRFTNFTG